MADPFLVNIADRPDLEKPGADGKRAVPGLSDDAPMMDKARGTTRYLGREAAEGGVEGPYAYYSDRPAGDVIPMHRHSANRTEFLISGSIEWREPGKKPRIYGAGTLSHVEAGTIYGYKVIEDAPGSYVKMR